VIKISVCMASYNGARRIGEQIESILAQLFAEDELIIVDDGSRDETVTVIERLDDTRIRLFRNAVNIGVVPSFERALRLATGSVICLADQDDRWIDGKARVIRDLFGRRDIDIIIHDAIVTDGKRTIAESLFRLRNTRSGVLRNIWSNTYVGCCMAFRSRILDDILPIPVRLGVWHDAWIGILAESLGYEVALVDEKLIEFIRHESNVSTLKGRRNWRVIGERLNLIWALSVRIAVIKLCGPALGGKVRGSREGDPA